MLQDLCLWFITRKLSPRQSWRRWVCYYPSGLVQRPKNDLLGILLRVFLSYLEHVSIVLFSHYSFQMESSIDFITILFTQLPLPILLSGLWQQLHLPVTRVHPTNSFSALQSVIPTWNTSAAPHYPQNTPDSLGWCLSSGCHNNISQTWWLSQQEFISH